MLGSRVNATLRSRLTAVAVRDRETDFGSPPDLGLARTASLTRTPLRSVQHVSALRRPATPTRPLTGGDCTRSGQATARDLSQPSTLAPHARRRSVKREAPSLALGRLLLLLLLDVLLLIHIILHLEPFERVPIPPRPIGQADLRAQRARRGEMARLIAACSAAAYTPARLADRVRAGLGSGRVRTTAERPPPVARK